MHLRLLSTLLVLSISLSAIAAEKDTKPAKPSPWKTVANPDLPNVLILGDSISIGYTLGVKKALEGKANVFRPTRDGKGPENCAGTTRGVEQIDGWLAGRKWDVIHFNWGLHDLKHQNAETGKASQSLDDPRQAEPDTYRKQLAEIVDKLKATDAKLIFATTTPYPDGCKPARLPADAKLYNDIALEIMKENDIEVHDLYAKTLDKLGELQIPKNVHFHKKGNVFLAAEVAECLAAALED